MNTIGELNKTLSERDLPDGAKDKKDASSSLFDEFYGALKYTAVQKTYDGVAQAVNHLGGDMAPRQLVKAPDQKELYSKEWMAQTAGAGLATIAGVMAVHKGLSSLGKATGVATGSARTFGEVVVGRTTARSLALSGAVYEGLTAQSRDDNSFWKDRLINSGVAGASIYAAARLHSGMSDMARLSQPIFGKSAASMIERQLSHGGIGFVAGAAGGAISAEGHSILGKGQLASARDLSTQCLTGGIMGGAFGLIGRPVDNNAVFTRKTGQLPGLQAFARVGDDAGNSSGNAKINLPDLKIGKPLGDQTATALDVGGVVKISGARTETQTVMPLSRRGTQDIDSLREGSSIVPQKPAARVEHNQADNIDLRNAVKPQE